MAVSCGYTRFIRQKEWGSARGGKPMSEMDITNWDSKCAMGTRRPASLMCDVIRTRQKFHDLFQLSSLLNFFLTTLFLLSWRLHVFSLYYFAGARVTSFFLHVLIFLHLNHTTFSD